MHDGWAVALAVSVVAGALLSGSLARSSSGTLTTTVTVAGAATLVGLIVLGLIVRGLIVRGAALRRDVLVPVLWCGAGVVLAFGLGGRAWDGATPLAPRPVHDVVTVLGDPQRFGPSVRVLVRWRHHRVEAWGRQGAAGVLAGVEVGEHLVVRGRLAPPADAARERLARRHVVGRLTVERAERLGGAPRVQAAATRLRELLAHGARSLPSADRALFTGVVMGDDREVPVAVVDDMRAAGLGHLTAVSGQNVAFVLATVWPLVRRLRPGARWVASLAVLGAFCLLTRGEPSVLRACAMAAVAATALALARPVSSVRLLALAVAGLVLVDPMLVWSVGFALSAGATLGLVLGAGRLAALVPGPRPLALAVGVTLAAQAGVAPLSIAVFGGLPPASVLANVLAVPAAGPLMVWGLTAGLVAGFLPDPLAALLHLPTLVLLRWITTVASVAAAVPLGLAGWPSVALLGLTAAGLAWARRVAAPARRRALRCTAVASAVVALVLLPAAATRPAPSHDRTLGGAQLWVVPEPGRRAAVVVVLGRADGRVPDLLRRAGVRRADVLVVAVADRDVDALAAHLVRRLAPRVVLAPPASSLPTAERPAVGAVLEVGAVWVEVVDAGRRRLGVEVAVPQGGRAPPRSAAGPAGEGR